MAAIKNPAPGTRLGPCEGPCPHPDCYAVRVAAAKVCPDCREAIGYDRWYFSDPDHPGEDVHELCLYQRIDNRKEKDHV